MIRPARFHLQSNNFAVVRLAAVAALMLVPFGTATAQTSSPAATDSVVVDLSVLNGGGRPPVAGVGGGPDNMPSGQVYFPGQPMMPGARAPQSRLHVAAPGAPMSRAVLKRPTSQAPAAAEVKPATESQMQAAARPVVPSAPAPTQAPAAPAQAAPKQLASKPEQPKSAPAAPAPMPVKKAPPPPPPVSSAKAPAPPPQTAPAPEPAPPAKVAKAEAETQSASVPASEAPRAENIKAGSKITVVFDEQATKLPGDAETGLAGLVGQLKDKESLRVQLMAYAGGKDLSPSKARRMSLSRALSVRSHLIENGVRSTRIDVRALGSKTEEKPVNRVDVNVVER